MRVRELRVKLDGMPEGAEVLFDHDIYGLVEIDAIYLRAVKIAEREVESMAEMGRNPGDPESTKRRVYSVEAGGRGRAVVLE